SAVMRWSASDSNRALSVSGSDEPRISNRRWMAVETLLTFWPPAPCARIASIRISSSGRDRVLSMTNMGSICREKNFYAPCHDAVLMRNHTCRCRPCQGEGGQLRMERLLILFPTHHLGNLLIALPHVQAMLRRHPAVLLVANVIYRDLIEAMLGPR